MAFSRRPSIVVGVACVMLASCSNPGAKPATSDASRTNVEGSVRRPASSPAASPTPTPSATPQPSPTPSATPAPDKLLYVADSSKSTVDIFDPRARGDVAPVGTISGANTGLTNPNALAVAPDGKIFVLNVLQNPLYAPGVTEYAHGARGDVAPLRSWTLGGLLKNDIAFDIAADSSDRFYVTARRAQSTRAVVVVYPAGASGVLQPIGHIDPPGNGNASGVKFDSHHRLLVSYTLSATNGGVATYDLGPPLKMLADLLTLGVAPAFVAVDDATDDFETLDAGQGLVFRYAPLSNGFASPLAYGLAQGYGEFADGHGGLTFTTRYAVNARASGFVYVSGPKLNPAGVIHGPKTGLVGPEAVVLGPP